MRIIYEDPTSVDPGGPVSVRVLVEVFVPDGVEDREEAAREAVLNGEYKLVEILEVE